DKAARAVSISARTGPAANNNASNARRAGFIATR
ncbi:MAG: hypothetical protein ACI9JL_004086, partial [Paracoccaceae bacterium]